MKTRHRTYQMTIAALLCAIGIVIPLFSPLKISLEPASFTLASHVAIFIAMFISPLTAVIVAIGTTIGFFLGGFPIVIVMRAATHLIFAFVGALILKKKGYLLDSAGSAFAFSFGIAIVHALSEIAVVIPFYFGNNMTQGYYAKGFFISVVLLVGVGSVIHSMVDFFIALLVWRPIRKTVKVSIGENI